MSTAMPTIAACRVRVRGVVQGVGFRPFVHRLALRHQLAGWVRNASGEVTVLVEGHDQAIAAFLLALRAEAPTLARIESVEVDTAAPVGAQSFRIEVSAEPSEQRLPVPPDVGLCAACEAELRDPRNRRYHYPFITCTDCGPRYTVIERLPYDRERTTMQVFRQCPECEREYRTPGDRRYHSETNSCPACGPTLWLETGAPGQARATGPGAVRDAGLLLTRGAILALRGFGGFHLACDATSEEAVALLRTRKHREAKPLAVMVRDLEAAGRLAELNQVAEALLLGPERPVVLLPRLPGGPLADSLAPGLDTVGLMLPSTPLHLLLADAADRPLVMTSGNLSEEPIAIGNSEARRRLAGIADAFLLHDRQILSRSDDSVVRVAGIAPVFLRRSRGYAPLPLRLPVASPVPLLAVGPHLKNTFTLVCEDRAWVSPHIGDLESLEGLEHFRQALAVYRRLFRIEPRAVVHDLHPGYLSTRVAQELGLPHTIAVQHHQAHVAAVMAEHGETGRVLGLAFDGTGYGSDGTTWGAELFIGGLGDLRRAAHLRAAPMPGGDLAARRPWRALLGYTALDGVLRDACPRVFDQVPRAELALAEQQMASGLNAPLTSSMGRLFDAAAAILGVRQESAYEGQAAMELEALAGRRIAAEYPVPIEEDEAGGWILNPIPMLTRLAIRRQRGVDPGDLAADFHASIARAAEMLICRAAETSGLAAVVLSGGTFQNARLLTSVRRRLERRRFRVLTARELPPNDGAISYGQAALAAAQLAAAHGWRRTNDRVSGSAERNADRG